uniref:Uncharacterized protein n=1 Tax=Anguilla anguilla TaxID=7936 RepID=A0A0E9UA49_ANGAN
MIYQSNPPQDHNLYFNSSSLIALLWPFSFLQPENEPKRVNVHSTIISNRL